MSSAMVSTAAAQGRFFFSDKNVVPEMPFPPAKSWGEVPVPGLADPRLAAVTPASRLGVRPAPEMLSSGIAAINALTGGWPRGCLTEICGPPSSGRTTVLLAALAAATRSREFCVLVDASDALDPRSVADAGVELERLLWVRCGEISPRRRGETGKNFPQANQGSQDQKRDDLNCEYLNSGRPGKNRTDSRNLTRQAEHRLEQVLRATDLLLESGGFGLVVLDLSDLPPQQARRIPLTTWFRFRRAIEHTPTVLLAVAQQPMAGSCSSLRLQLGEFDKGWKGFAVPDSSLFHDVHPAHAQLLSSLEITAKLVHSRMDRKPASSITFATKTAWAG